MRIEDFDYDAIDASREVIEAFVCQTYHVKIWHHETDDAVVYSYTRWKLPEGFRGVIDVESFTTKTPLVGFKTAIQVSIELGEIEEDLVFDNLAEPLALLTKLSMENDINV